MASIDTYRIRKLDPDLCTLELSIETTTEFKVRVAVGLWLMKLGARIIGCGVTVNQEK